ncbi:MAG: hypothetical protein ACXW2T_04250 [Allosphingosinicella sp.]
MISRGTPSVVEAAPVRLEPEPRLRAVPCEPEPSRPESPAAREDAPAPDYQLVHFRLEAIERLSLLRDKGALSTAEYEAEKNLVLRLPADELDSVRNSLRPPPGPSLLGRILGWKIVLAGLAAGLGFVAFTAPQELTGLIDRFSRLLG